MPNQIKNTTLTAPPATMVDSVTENTWVPTIRLDLATASKQSFEDAVDLLWRQIKERKDANTLPAFPFDRDGWYEVTPEMAEAALMHSAGNRECSFSTAKAYASDMANRDWQPTGETINSSNGVLGNGHHRLLAGLLSGQTFRCYVVVSAPSITNVFAYFDSGKKRTPADALHIAGWNSSSKALASAIANLAVRYDNGVLGVGKQPRAKPVNARDVLRYMQHHGDFRDAAQLMLGSYPEAVAVIRSKSAAIFFAWLVLRAYDEATLRDFCEPLGTGALLEEDSPLLAARAKLLAPEVKGNKMPDRTRLAYVCKAFRMHIAGQKMPRTRGGRVQPLGLEVDEAFPRIDPPVAEVEAA
jgi:hypothetical protein